MPASVTHGSAHQPRPARDAAHALERRATERDPARGLVQLTSIIVPARAVRAGPGRRSHPFVLLAVKSHPMTLDDFLLEHWKSYGAYMERKERLIEVATTIYLAFVSFLLTR